MFPSRQFLAKIEQVDLNSFLTGDPDACLLVPVKGIRARDVPVFDGDWVILDCIRRPRVNNIVVVRHGDHHSIERYRGKRGLYLVSHDFVIIGVVTFIIHPTG